MLPQGDFGLITHRQFPLKRHEAWTVTAAGITVTGVLIFASALDQGASALATNQDCHAAEPTHGSQRITTSGELSLGPKSSPLLVEGSHPTDMFSMCSSAMSIEVAIGVTSRAVWASK